MQSRYAMTLCCIPPLLHVVDCGASLPHLLFVLGLWKTSYTSPVQLFDFVLTPA